MADWIVRKYPDGKVEVITDRGFPRQEFTGPNDLPQWRGETAVFQAFAFIEGDFEWGDRILTQEVSENS